MLSNEVGFVLFGIGRAGSIHRKNLMLNAKAHLLYVVDPRIEAAQEFAAACQPPAIALRPEDMKDALTDDAVRIAVVASTTHTHENIIIACLNADKSVLCEKPLAMNIDSIAKMYETARSKNLHLLCAFNRRFDATFRRLHQAVVSDDIGNIRMIKITSRDSPKPSFEYLSQSGGIIHDCVVHDIDMARFMTGEDPMEVIVTAHAHDAQIEAMDDVDAAVVTLKFPSGAIATIDVDRNAAYGYDQRVEVYGDKGMVQAENRRENSMIYSNKDGSHRDRIFNSFPSRHEKAYELEIEHIIECVEKNTPVWVTAHDTLVATLVCNAATDALKNEHRIKINYNSLLMKKT